MKPAKDMIEAAAPFHCLERFTSGSKPCASICDYCMKSAEAALTAALSVQWRGMIEEGAKGAYEAHREPGDPSWDELSEPARNGYRILAKGALTAALSFQWRGMESAPKDTPILMFTPAEKLFDPPFDPKTAWDIRVSTTRNWYWETHWMPLPPPPAIQE